MDIKRGQLRHLAVALLSASTVLVGASARAASTHHLKAGKAWAKIRRKAAETGLSAGERVLFVSRRRATNDKKLRLVMASNTASLYLQKKVGRYTWKTTETIPMDDRRTFKAIWNGKFKGRLKEPHTPVLANAWIDPFNGKARRGGRKKEFRIDALLGLASGIVTDGDGAKPVRDLTDFLAGGNLSAAKRADRRRFAREVLFEQFPVLHQVLGSVTPPRNGKKAPTVVREIDAKFPNRGGLLIPVVTSEP